MDELIITLIKMGAGGATGIALASLAYVRILASRLDDIRSSLQDVANKVSRLEAAVTAHEVRITVLERLEKPSEAA